MLQSEGRFCPNLRASLQRLRYKAFVSMLRGTPAIFLVEFLYYLISGNFSWGCNWISATLNLIIRNIKGLVYGNIFSKLRLGFSITIITELGVFCSLRPTLLWTSWPVIDPLYQWQIVDIGGNQWNWKPIARRSRARQDNRKRIHCTPFYIYISVLWPIVQIIFRQQKNTNVVHDLNQR